MRGKDFLKEFFEDAPATKFGSYGVCVAAAVGEEFTDFCEFCNHDGREASFSLQDIDRYLRGFGYIRGLIAGSAPLKALKLSGDYDFFVCHVKPEKKGEPIRHILWHQGEVYDVHNKDGVRLIDQYDISAVHIIRPVAVGFQMLR